MAENEMLMERFGLAMERIGLVQEEQKGRDGVHDFFFRTAQFICDMAKLKQLLESGEIYKDLELLSQWNQKIYADITGDAYEKSYANPSYAVSQLGEEERFIVPYMLKLEILLSMPMRRIWKDLLLHWSFFWKFIICFWKRRPQKKSVRRCIGFIVTIPNFLRRNR